MLSGKVVLLSTGVLSAAVVLLSTGVLSAAVALRLSAPTMSAFFRSDVPRIYEVLLLWLTPPYLYLVLNSIIISIAASSRFQKLASAEEGSEVATAAAPAVKASAETRPEDPPPPVVFEIGNGPEEDEGRRQEGFLLTLVGYGAGEGGADGKMVLGRDASAKEEGGEEEEEEEFVISRSGWTPAMRGPAAEKPPVSARFTGRRGVKASPEGTGRALGVAKPKKQETLESTWKTITDGRPMPLARHLRKSDTWGDDGGGRAPDEAVAATPPMRKAETFRERRVGSRSPSPSPGGLSRGRMLRREASPGQEELNRRVEAFIRKFNEEMRLQRQ